MVFVLDFIQNLHYNI